MTPPVPRSPEVPRSPQGPYPRLGPYLRGLLPKPLPRAYLCGRALCAGGPGCAGATAPWYSPRAPPAGPAPPPPEAVDLSAGRSGGPGASGCPGEAGSALRVESQRRPIAQPPGQSALEGPQRPYSGGPCLLRRRRGRAREQRLPGSGSLEGAGPAGCQ